MLDAASVETLLERHDHSRRAANLAIDWRVEVILKSPEVLRSGLTVNLAAVEATLLEQLLVLGRQPRQSSPNLKPGPGCRSSKLGSGWR